MKHISITYSPLNKSWETMVDGNQLRSVEYRGTKRDCIRKALDLCQTDSQPVFLFDKDGLNPTRLIP